jgi:hypothetical protein
LGGLPAKLTGWRPKWNHRRAIPVETGSRMCRYDRFGPALSWPLLFAMPGVVFRAMPVLPKVHQDIQQKNDAQAIQQKEQCHGDGPPAGSN